MFFQVDLSPVKKAQKKKVQQPQEEISQLTLAPFTNTPKLLFEDVLVGTTAVQKLNIKNPAAVDVKLIIAKLPPRELNVSFSWVETYMPAISNQLLEIEWTPIESGSWRHVIKIGDGQRIRKDIAITFNSICTKPTNIKGKHAKTSIGANKKPQKKTAPTWRTSPVRKFTAPKTVSKQTRMPLQSNTKLPDIVVNSPIRRETYDIHDKENMLRNIENMQLSPFEMSKANSTFQRASNDVLTFYLHDRDNSFNDSLETVTPKRNMLQSTKIHNEFSPLMKDKLQEFCLTPITSFNPGNCSTGEQNRHNNLTFDANSSGKTLNISGGTYVKGNISAETYVKGNISGETYVKGNLSGETYNKDEQNVSGGTFTLDKSNDSLTYLLETSVGPLDARKGKPTSLQFGGISSPLQQSMEDLVQKRTLECIAEESLLNVSSGSKSFRKRKSVLPLQISPPKRQLVEMTKSWTKKPAMMTRQKINKGFNLKQFIEKTRVHKKRFEIEKSVVLHNPDAYLTEINNPMILAATQNVDPFMSATLYYEPKWLDQQEKQFKKWMNVLVRPPDELASNAESHPVDVARLWQECKNANVSKAPTKEEVSSKYHTAGLLDTLRRKAVQMFKTLELSRILSKCVMLVENGKLALRTDRDIHLDLVLQHEVMRLFLSYNPLWLRIGLETVFGKTLPLLSNSDLVGISSFIMKNFFRDQYLLNKHKSIHSLKYSVDIKKHALKKFIMLVYFLDTAKEKKLIQYDPCLFCKNAPYKESKALMQKFAAEVISSVGDIIKCLRLTGCNLVHKQTFIHEYDFAVSNLGGDLRDGVRLTKIMEIILLRDDLLQHMRLPAISRLQKIHNVKVAFDALTEANYNIQQDITPKDIVDGHREKTLSFLWQIIYKFQAPRFTKAIVRIQNWWNSLGVVITRRINQREKLRREAAAVVIQRWYKRICYRTVLDRFLPLLRKYLEYRRQYVAATKIQATYRMYRQRNVYKHIIHTIIALQSYTRKWVVKFRCEMKLYAVRQIQSYYRAYLQRKRFLELKRCVIMTEERYVAKTLMRAERERYQNLRAAVCLVQSRFRANKVMTKHRNDFITLKHATINIQQRYRARVVMNKVMLRYHSLKQAVLIIQQQFKANRLMKLERKNYTEIKQSVITIQRKYRSYKLMERERIEFLETKHAVIVIQQQLRAHLYMKKQRNEYIRLKNAAIVVQRRFRANMLMKEQRLRFMSVILAASTIQKHYLAYKLSKEERCKYLQLKHAAGVIQVRFRALKLMKQAREDYMRKYRLITYVQSKFRATQAMKLQKCDYLKQKDAVIKLQVWYRSLIMMRNTRDDYRRLRKAAMCIQRHFRALCAMKVQRKLYIRHRNYIIYVQRKFRAIQSMKNQQAIYKQQKQAAILIQRWYKGVKLTEKVRIDYLKIKLAIITVQTQFRALQLMKQERDSYISKRRLIIFVQRRYRANKAMKEQRCIYLMNVNAAVNIQRWYRSIKAMRIVRNNYNKFKNATICIQRKYRALKLMKQERETYIRTRNLVVWMQRRFKANCAMNIARRDFVMFKRSVVKLQSLYRRNVMMRRYVQMRNAALIIQTRYRAQKLMREEREKYIQTRAFIIYIQRQFRANCAMKIARKQYIQQKQSIIKIQNWYKSIKAMRKVQNNYQRIRNSVIIIQARYRAQKLMKVQRSVYLQQCKKIIYIQRKIKATQLMKKERESFLQLKRAALLIQRKYRGLKATRVQRKMYLSLKNAAIGMQRRYRAILIKRKCIEDWKLRKQAALMILQYYRGYKQMKQEMAIKNKKLTMITKLQAYAKGYLVRKKTQEMMTPEMREIRKMNLSRKNSATKIQALWRGFQTRKVEPNSLTKIRRKCREVTKKSKKENTLGHKKFEALKIIENEKSTYVQMIKALEDIDCCTNSCKTTCLYLSEKISESIGTLIITSGRSLPDMQACIVAANILITFFKYPLSSERAWLPGHIEGIINVMLHWCDKEGPFLLLATLIWLYCQNSRKRRLIRGVVNLSQKLEKMAVLCERKQKMDMRKSNRGASALRLSGVLPMPITAPDWGLEYPDKPRCFKSPVHAIQSLLEILK